MNKTKDERIRHALSGVNRRIVSIFRRVNVYDTGVENEFSVEVEFLREKDYATCRRFWVACNVSAEVALAIVLAVRAYVAEQFRVLSDEEKAAIRKRERRIRLAARKKKRKTTARVRSKKKPAPAPVPALDHAESTKAPAPAEAPKAEEKKPEKKKLRPLPSEMKNAPLNITPEQLKQAREKKLDQLGLSRFASDTPKKKDRSKVRRGRGFDASF